MANGLVAFRSCMWCAAWTPLPGHSGAGFVCAHCSRANPRHSVGVARVEDGDGSTFLVDLRSGEILDFPGVRWSVDRWRDTLTPRRLEALTGASRRDH